MHDRNITDHELNKFAYHKTICIASECNRRRRNEPAEAGRILGGRQPGGIIYQSAGQRKTGDKRRVPPDSFHLQGERPECERIRTEISQDTERHIHRLPRFRAAFHAGGPQETIRHHTYQSGKPRRGLLDERTCLMQGDSL